MITENEYPKLVTAVLRTLAERVTNDGEIHQFLIALGLELQNGNTFYKTLDKVRTDIFRENDARNKNAWLEGFKK